jgi:hypothetical protein
VVGNCVHIASNDVLYYAISAGSLASVLDYLRATVFYSGASSPSLLLSAG